MDIHRCRFVPYQPPAISALAFSHISDPSRPLPKDVRLALGRENGDIELWNPAAGRWTQETVLRGSVGSTVEQISWTQDLTVDETEKAVRAGRLRLFSIGGSDAVYEWSLSSGSRIRHADSNFGNIWCFAAQPAYTTANGELPDSIPSQLLVAGTEKGNVVLFSTADGGLNFQQLLLAAPSRSPKVLSITWRDRNTVVAGYDNGLIRVIDVASRRTIRQMSLGKTPEGSVAVVWSVKCLQDGTIVSGDSSGELKIWDPSNFSLVQRLKSHQADILDITASAKGDQIYTFGVDRRTVAYQIVPMQPGQKKRRWAQVMHRRFHDHDVKCAASYESKGFSVLVSGGMDASPVILPMRNWQSEFHRSLPHLPQQPQISASRNRLLLAWWATDLQVYLIPQRHGDGEQSLGTDDFDLLATLKLKDDGHIQSAQISHDGTFVVASTSKGVRLFQLRRTQVDGAVGIRSRLVALPASLQNFGARHVGISPNNRWLYAVRFDGTVIVVKMLPTQDPKSPPTFHPKNARLEPESDEQDDDTLGTYTDQISVVSVSTDSRVLSTGSLSGRVTAWTLEGHEDLSATTSDANSQSDSSDSESDSDEEDDSPTIHAQRWTRAPLFPRLDSSILTLCIRQSPSPSPTKPTASPNSTPRSNIALHATRHNPHPLAHEHPTPNTTLLVLTSSHTLTELSLTSGKLTAWSRRNPSSLLPTRFRTIKDRALGMFLHSSRLWLYGSTWLYMLDLSIDFPSPTSNSILTETPNPTKKRKRPHPSLLKGTGAGDRILSSRQRDSAVAPTGIKYRGEEGALEVVQLDDRMLPASDDDDVENDPAVTEELLRLRRNEQDASGTPRKQGRGGKGKVGGVLDGAENGVVQRGDGAVMHEFCTFRYRAIFGVGVLSDGSGLSDAVDADGDVDMSEEGLQQRPANGNVAGGLEVVIVERPMYEVPQSARFDGGQDWDV